MLGLPAGVRSFVARSRSPAGIRSLVARYNAPHILDVRFQCLARGLWYLVLVPTST